MGRTNYWEGDVPLLSVRRVFRVRNNYQGWDTGYALKLSRRGLRERTLIIKEGTPGTHPYYKGWYSGYAL